MKGGKTGKGRSLDGIKFPVGFEPRLVVRLRPGIGGLHLGRDPGLDRRAADGRIDQADRHADLPADLAAKEIQRGGEAADVVRCAELPRAFALGLGCVGGARALAVMADERILRRRLLGIEVVTTRDRHRHVRLPGAEPHLTHEHILHLDLVSPLPRDDERAGLRAGRQSIQL